MKLLFVTLTFLESVCFCTQVFCVQDCLQSNFTEKQKIQMTSELEDQHEYIMENQKQMQMQMQMRLKKLSIQKMRPKILRKAIKAEFNTIKDYSINNQCHWVHYGTAEYCFLGINALSIIKGINEGKKLGDRLTILDVGAGNGMWGDFVLEQIFQSLDFFGEVINIYSLTGESVGNANESIITKKENITHYLLGNVQLENISKTKIYKELKNNVDLIVSRLCLIHLCDSAGTITQLRKLLIPKHGIMAFDGTNVEYTDGKESFSCLPRLLLGYGDSFFTTLNNLENFSAIFRRENKKQITLEYVNVDYCKEYANSTEKLVALLKSNEALNIVKIKKNKLYGNNLEFYKQFIGHTQQNEKSFIEKWNSILI